MIENDERGYNDDEDDMLGDEDGADPKGDGLGQQGKTGDGVPAAGTGGTITQQSKSGTSQGAALEEEMGIGFVPVSCGQQVAQEGAVGPNPREACGAHESAAIPEVLVGSKSTRPSKRRGTSTDDLTLEWAEKIKA